MSGVRAEQRTAVIAMVEVSWQEQDGSFMGAQARVEDRSPSGACIRVKKPIRVGSPVRIKWRWEEYQGVAKYCRTDAGEYLMGIQRVTTPVRPGPPLQVGPGEITLDQVRPLPVVHISTSPQDDSMLPVKASRTCHPEDLAAAQGPDIQSQQASESEERTSMSTKWLDSALKRQKQDPPNGKPNGALMQEISVHEDTTPASSNHTNGAAKDPARSDGDLQSMEDIYRSAGIMNPRMGYSIRKVVEMLNSEHLRGLSNDAKRAAVLMALDAAGITMDEILRDARQRQSALDAYEAGQRKQFDEYWTRKAEANAQIQKELERITAQSLDRIKRCQDEVSLEKAAFAEWQRSKQQEADRIAEAVGLCLKLTSSESPGTSLIALPEMQSASKPS